MPNTATKEPLGSFSPARGENPLETLKSAYSDALAAWNSLESITERVKRLSDTQTSAISDLQAMCLWDIEDTARSGQNACSHVEYWLRKIIEELEEEAATQGEENKK